MYRYSPYRHLLYRLLVCLLLLVGLFPCKSSQATVFRFPPSIPLRIVSIGHWGNGAFIINVEAEGNVDNGEVFVPLPKEYSAVVFKVYRGMKETWPEVLRDHSDQWTTTYNGKVLQITHGTKIRIYVRGPRPDADALRFPLENPPRLRFTR